MVLLSSSQQRTVFTSDWRIIKLPNEAGPNRFFQSWRQTKDVGQLYGRWAPLMCFTFRWPFWNETGGVVNVYLHWQWITQKVGGNPKALRSFEIKSQRVFLILLPLLRILYSLGLHLVCKNNPTQSSRPADLWNYILWGINYWIKLQNLSIFYFPHLFPPGHIILSNLDVLRSQKL